LCRITPFIMHFGRWPIGDRSPCQAGREFAFLDESEPNLMAHTSRAGPHKRRRDQMESTNIGIAGEFYVLAQLAQRGFVASFTLAALSGISRCSQVKLQPVTQRQISGYGD
jgi:hypothetical protein